MGKSAIWILVLLLWGCTAPGPLYSPGFDPSFAQTLAPGETLLHYAEAELNAGSFMEEEMESHPHYMGVVLLTDRRWLFATWSAEERRYRPLVWIAYGDIRQVKKHHSILLQYIALRGRDGSQNAYFLSQQSVEPVYTLLRERIRLSYARPHGGANPAGAQ